jgi:hypothetical protein
MLNEPLYRALKAITTDVEIVAEDEPAEIRSTGAAGAWELGDSGMGTRGQQFKANCPFCNDRRGRLYISYLSLTRPMLNGVEGSPAGIIGICFNEQCLANPSKREQLKNWLLSYLDEAIPTVEATRYGDREAKASAEAPSNELTLDGIRSWVPDYTPLGECTDTELLKYLADRGITASDATMFHLGYGPVVSRKTGAYMSGGANYALFPWIENGKVSGIQARLPDYHPLCGKRNKWWISPKCRKTVNLYNIDNAIACNCAVVTEGVFDAIAVGRPGVATFGDAPSKLQLQKIAKVGGIVIWIPDNQRSEKVAPMAYAAKAVEQLNGIPRFGAHIVTLPEPYKDCGEMPRHAIWECILGQLKGPAREHIEKNVIKKVFADDHR